MDPETALLEVEAGVRARAEAGCHGDRDLYEDLCGEQRLVLLQRLPHFDPRRASWHTYASHVGSSAVRHYLRDKAHLVKARPDASYAREGRPVMCELDERLPAPDSTEAAIARVYWAEVFARAELTKGEAFALGAWFRGELLARSAAAKGASRARRKVRTAVVAMGAAG